LDKVTELRAQCEAMMARLHPGNERLDWDDLKSLSTASLDLPVHGVEVLMYASFSFSHLNDIEAIAKGHPLSYRLAVEALQDAKADLIKLQEIAAHIKAEAPESPLARETPNVLDYAEGVVSWWAETESLCTARYEARAKGGANKSFAFAFHP